MRAVNKRGWIWLAVATFAMAYVSCAQTSIEGARACAHPVLQFLAGDQASAASGAPWLEQHRQSKGAAFAVAERDAHAGLWASMLPVRFIGVVAPLNLLAPRSLLCLGRTPAAPQLPARFQRPPPPFA